MATDMGTPEKKEDHQAHNMRRRRIEKHFKGIHDRFLRDPEFRVSMLEHDRDEEVCIKMYDLIQRIWYLHLRTARREMKRESLNTLTQSPHFQSRSGLLNHTGGTYSHSGLMVESWKISCLCGISKLESQLQD